MPDKQVGQIVRAHYKSGTYIGEITEDRGDRFLITVLAVQKHPMQGDLHNPGKVDEVFFHERKALAYKEKVNVAKPAVHPFEEEVPDYSLSRQNAVNKLKEKLASKDSDFNKRALKTLEALEEQYN